MNISFSTINKITAEKYLTDEKYSYLNESQKAVVLKHVGAEVLRVQDPMMYASPCLEITDKEIYDEIMGAKCSD